MLLAFLGLGDLVNMLNPDTRAIKFPAGEERFATLHTLSTAEAVELSQAGWTVVEARRRLDAEEDKWATFWKNADEAWGLALKVLGFTGSKLKLSQELEVTELGEVLIELTAKATMFDREEMDIAGGIAALLQLPIFNKFRWFINAVLFVADKIEFGGSRRLEDMKLQDIPEDFRVKAEGESSRRLMDMPEELDQLAIRASEESGEHVETFRRILKGVTLVEKFYEFLRNLIPEGIKLEFERKITNDGNAGKVSIGRLPISLKDNHAASVNALTSSCPAQKIVKRRLASRDYGYKLAITSAGSKSANAIVELQAVELVTADGQNANCSFSEEGQNQVDKISNEAYTLADVASRNVWRSRDHISKHLHIDIKCERPATEFRFMASKSDEGREPQRFTMTNDDGEVLYKQITNQKVDPNTFSNWMKMQPQVEPEDSNAAAIVLAPIVLAMLW